MRSAICTEACKKDNCFKLKISVVSNKHFSGILVVPMDQQVMRSVIMSYMKDLQLNMFITIMLIKEWRLLQSVCDSSANILNFSLQILRLQGSWIKQNHAYNEILKPLGFKQR